MTDFLQFSDKVQEARTKMDHRFFKKIRKQLERQYSYKCLNSVFMNLWSLKLIMAFEKKVWLEPSQAGKNPERPPSPEVSILSHYFGLPQTLLPALLHPSHHNPMPKLGWRILSFTRDQIINRKTIPQLG